MSICVNETSNKKINKPLPAHAYSFVDYKVFLTLTNLAGDIIDFHCKFSTERVTIYPSKPALYRLIIYYLMNTVTMKLFSHIKTSRRKASTDLLRGLNS